MNREIQQRLQWGRLHKESGDAVRRFKSAGQAQRFLTVYGVVGKVFILGQHLTRAIHYREFRSRTFTEWQEVTCVQMMVP